MRTLLALLFLLMAPANASTEIRVGVHNFPPYFVVKGDNTCGGEAVELTRNILQTDTITVRAVCATPARLFKMLSRGEVDLTINIKQTKTLPNNVSFINPPYAQLSLVLLTYNNQSTALTSLQQPTIAAIRGFDYLGQRQILSERGFLLIDLPDSIDAIKMFVKGRSNGLLTYEAPFSFYLAQQPPQLTQRYQRQLLEYIDAYYVISDQSLHKLYISTTLSDYAATKQLRYFTQ
ncbi:hypothetical protein VT06_02305 [Arsukibacterium sp. MJ3]|uniref:substrate-binding periplasmic protein n=1 Tax=Arsukibacterium sp. MJ3 TaxID=1632859 RepID=UPI0006270307|nr:transporter substrate-binding domain-containing protein [Arsukibacterium sp. MJ3]KKO50299.1 hypothetical protein VT06_02305 [Arsukibacterium sp. MJ3]